MQADNFPTMDAELAKIGVLNKSVLVARVAYPEDNTGRVIEITNETWAGLYETLAEFQSNIEAVMTKVLPKKVEEETKERLWKEYEGGQDNDPWLDRR